MGQEIARCCQALCDVLVADRALAQETLWQWQEPICPIPGTLPTDSAPGAGGDINQIIAAAADRAFGEVQAETQLFQQCQFPS